MLVLNGRAVTREDVLRFVANKMGVHTGELKTKTDQLLNNMRSAGWLTNRDGHTIFEVNNDFFKYHTPDEHPEAEFTLNSTRVDMVLFEYAGAMALLCRNPQTAELLDTIKREAH